MSYFRNVSNDGTWLPGGIYTFEVWKSNELAGECGINSIWNDGFSLVRDTPNESYPNCPYMTSGNILFTNHLENFTGGIEGLTVLETEVLEDGWTKYTVQVAENLSPDIYYLKHSSHHCCIEFT